jgi:hypothetical protein
MSVTIVLADGHDIYRQGLRLLLEGQAAHQANLGHAHRL